jgi:hypothetical protein
MPNKPNLNKKSPLISGLTKEEILARIKSSDNYKPKNKSKKPELEKQGVQETLGPPVPIGYTDEGMEIYDLKDTNRLDPESYDMLFEYDVEQNKIDWEGSNKGKKHYLILNKVGPKKTVVHIETK